jgi:outer membrane protein TolC
MTTAGRPLHSRAASARAAWLALTLALPATAQEPTEALTPEQVAVELGYDLSEPLTLEQCIEIALRVHPDIEVAVANLDRATAGVREARASLWPSFTASTDYRVTQQPTRTVQIGGSIFPAGGGRSTARNTQVTGTLSVYQTGRQETISQARQYAKAAEAGLADARRRLAYLVARAYYDVLAGDRLIAVQEQSVAVAEGHVNLVQAQIDAEDAAPMEIHAVRSELHSAQLQLVSARNQAALARASLRSALGEPETAVELVDAWQEPRALPMLDECVEAALAERPDLDQARASLRGAELGVRLARLQQDPQFSIITQGEYGRYNSLSGASWTIYGQIQQSIFDGGATRAALARARAERRIAEADVTRAERDIRLEVEQAWLSLRESAERIATAEAGRVEAQANLDSAQQRYAANVAILLEITDAQAKATRADVDLLQSYYEYNTALADLRQAMGEAASEAADEEG